MSKANEGLAYPLNDPNSKSIRINCKERYLFVFFKVSFHYNTFLSGFHRYFIEKHINIIIISKKIILGDHISLFLAKIRIMNLLIDAGIVNRTVVDNLSKVSSFFPGIFQKSLFRIKNQVIIRVNFDCHC